MSQLVVVDEESPWEQHEAHGGLPPQKRALPPRTSTNTTDRMDNPKQHVERRTNTQPERTQSPPSVIDVRSSTQSPTTHPRNTTNTVSEGGSLNTLFRSSTLNERGNPTLSASQTLRSAPSQKRTGDEMQAQNPSVQSNHRPTKQPFSPSSTRALHNQDRHRNRSAWDTTPHDTSKVSSTPTPVSPTVSLSAPTPNSELAILKQPATRPITEQQLINEVKGIYAGLVMVEKKCVEIVAQQSQSVKRLSDQQWKALVALHRTLLQEHHDFFSASQHPTASETLKKLAIKYAMPARMWRHGIHAFLELLRHRLPDSMEHMLSFIYLAYSMMALLKESVPGFVETWIECLGDLARYRMAIEDTDPRDREIWSNVAKMWYNEAADRSPNVGRIQHHLAVLARPNIVEQLFYYDKALVSVVPFVNARESIMLLFDMFLKDKNSETVQSRYPQTEYAFVNTYAILFTRRAPAGCRDMMVLFVNSFGGHIDRTGARFKLQGPQMASSLFAGLLDFGKEDSHLWRLCSQQTEEADARKKAQEGQPAILSVSELKHLRASRKDYWEPLTFDTTVDRIPFVRETSDHEALESSEAVVAFAAPLTFQAITMVASRMGDKNCVPFMHVVLANVFSMSFVQGAVLYIETCIPWTAIMVFLNTIGRSGVSYLHIESDTLPPSHGGHGKQLPEDFLMRGGVTTRHYYEHDPNFFTGQLVDEDERCIELPSHQAPRAERVLWLGVQLAKLGRYLTYDLESKMFDTTEFARSLNTPYV